MGIIGIALDIVSGSVLGGIVGNLIPIAGAVGSFVTLVLGVAGAILLFKMGFFKKIIPV